MTPTQRRRAEVAVRVLDQLRDAYVLHGSEWPAAVSRWTIAEERRPAFDALVPAIDVASNRAGEGWLHLAADVRAFIVAGLDASTGRTDPTAEKFRDAMRCTSRAAPIASAVLSYVLPEPA